MRWGFFGWGRGGWVLRLWRSCFVTCMQRFFYIYLPGKNRLNTFADDARLYLGVTVQPIKSWLSVPSPCFPPLKKISYLRCCGDCAAPPPKLRDVAETLPSLALTALHCCVKVTAGPEGAGLACAAGDTKRSLQTSHRSTQTKRYSCNSGAAVQQSAGSVGGFNKKRVSLCALLDFGSAKGAGFCVDDMQQKKNSHEISCESRRHCAWIPSKLFVKCAQTLVQVAGMRRTGREARSAPAVPHLQTQI